VEKNQSDLTLIEGESIVGYRSTVAYSIRFIPKHSPDTDDIVEERKARASFFTFLAEAKANDQTALCFSEDDEHFKVDEETLSIYLFADGVKWYDDYPDVKCHISLMDLSKEWADENEYIGGAYAYMGDDMEDNVEETWGQGDYDWCCLRRFIECDWIK
jgi:hypothetical protein